MKINQNQDHKELEKIRTSIGKEILGKLIDRDWAQDNELRTKAYESLMEMMSGKVVKETTLVRILDGAGQRNIRRQEIITRAVEAGGFESLTPSERRKLYEKEKAALELENGEKTKSV